MQFNTLTLTLQSFVTAFSGGYGRLHGPIETLLALLVAIEVVFFGLWAALGSRNSVVDVFKEILHIGLWVWIVQSFPTLAKAFVESLLDAGLLAGGGTTDASLVLDPSRLAGYGLDATEPLAQKLEDLGALDIADLLVFGFGYVAIMVCFFLMAINVFLAVLEYYLLVACVGILLPFGVFRPTAFLSHRAVHGVVSAGIKLMVLGFITSVLDPVLRAFHFQGPNIALNELWAMLLTLCAMTALCWKAPTLAANVLAGSSHLGGDRVVDTVRAAAAHTVALVGRAAAAQGPAPKSVAGSAPLRAEANTRAEPTLVRSSTMNPLVDARPPTLSTPSSPPEG